MAKYRENFRNFSIGSENVKYCPIVKSKTDLESQGPTQHFISRLIPTVFTPESFHVKSEILVAAMSGI